MRSNQYEETTVPKKREGFLKYLDDPFVKAGWSFQRRVNNGRRRWYKMASFLFREKSNNK